MEYKGLEIGCIADCDENAGGYFCEVYTLEPYDRIDYFCIHPYELVLNPDPEFWIKNYIEHYYNSYVQKNLISNPFISTTELSKLSLDDKIHNVEKMKAKTTQAFPIKDAAELHR